MTQQVARRSPMGDPSPAATDPSFLRWAGYSGVLASAAFLGTVVVANIGGVAPPDGAAGIAGYLEEISAAAWRSYAYGVAGIALTILYVPMAVGVHRWLGRTAVSWFGSGAVIAGLAVLFPAYVTSVVLASGLAPVAVEVGSGGADALYVVYAYAGAAATVLFAIGSVLSLGLGPLLWGAAWLRARDGQRWLGWAAIVTGATGMVWFVPGASSPLAIVVIIVNVLVALVCFTGLSLAMLRAARTTSSTGR